MQHVIRIRDIRRRAERLNLSLKSACDGAGVEHSTVYRWLAETSNPGIVTFAAACERLEAWLSQREQALLTALAVEQAAHPARRSA